MLVETWPVHLRISVFICLCGRLTMRTAVNVKEGEQLFITYTYILSGTQARQELLRKGKFFSCKCERCIDPTELGTHFSSILCQKCEGGAIVSTNPLGMSREYIGSDWILIFFPSSRNVSRLEMFEVSI